MSKPTPAWVVAATFFGMGAASVIFLGFVGALAGGLAASIVILWFVMGRPS